MFSRSQTYDGKWVTDLCFVSHADGALLPDDWRYVFIVQALIALDEESELEADIYTSDLCAWLASNVNRVGYVDEVRDEYRTAESGIVADLQAGQLAEKREVLDLVSAFLKDLADDDDQED